MPEKDSAIQKSESANSNIENGQEELPASPEQMESMQKLFGNFFSMKAVMGPMGAHLTEKMNARHIDKILDQSEKDDERRYSYAVTQRKWTMAYVLIGVAIFLFLAFFIGKDNPDLFIELVKYILTFAFGFAGGMGYKYLADRKRQ